MVPPLIDVFHILFRLRSAEKSAFMFSGGTSGWMEWQVETGDVVINVAKNFLMVWWEFNRIILCPFVAVWNPANDEN